MHVSRVPALCGGLFLASSLASAQARLIVDLNRTPGLPRSSDPAHFAAVPAFGGTCFAATNAAVGREVWLADGSGSVRLAVDANPGTLSSDPEQLTAYGTGVAFTTQGAFGREVTYLSRLGQLPVVLEVNPGPGTSEPRQLTPSLGLLFFVADDGVHGRELWVTGGTTASTRLVRDLRTDASAEIQQMVSYPGGVAFIADDGISGFELWVSDGTAGGTRLAIDLNPGPGWGIGPSRPAAVGNQIWFAGDDGLTGLELWMTDGTAAGTRLVADIHAGPSHSYPRSLTALSDGRVAFVAQDSPFGEIEPWISNGTATGTLKLAVGGSHVSEVRDLGATSDGRFTFVAANATAGTELHISDGTVAGTRVIDLNPGLMGSDVSYPVVVGQLTYFTSDFRLRVSDGTVAGTTFLTPVGVMLPGNARPALRLGGGVIFAAISASVGTEPWSSDGSVAGTGLLLDLENTPTTADSTPHAVAEVGGRLLFTASDGSGLGLWSTDGAAARTFRLAGTSVRTAALAELPDAVLLVDNGLVRTDGTVAGTRLLSPVMIPVPQPPHRPGARLPDGRVVFTGALAPNPPAVWITDGTSAGTAELVLISPRAHLPPGDYLASGGLVFFVANDGVTGSELWRTDGSVAGTQLVRDLQPPSTTPPDVLGAVAGKVVFSADDGTGTALWVSDGTAAGTVLLAREFGDTARTAVSAGARLIVPVWNGAVGTDGTPAGTVRLPIPSRVAALIELDDITLLATVTQAGSTIHRSDGTVAGTSVVTTALPHGHAATTVRLSGSRAVFVILSFSFLPGAALAVVSDGTAAGTFPLLRMAQSDSFQPVSALAANGQLMFRQWDARSGVELWSLDLGATAQRAGVACGGSAEFRLLASEPRLGQNLSLRAPSPHPLTILLLGTPHAGAFPGLGACGLYVDVTRPYVTAAMPGGTLVVPIPALIELIGARLGTQAVAGPAPPFGVALSHGVRLVLDY